MESRFLLLSVATLLLLPPALSAYIAYNTTQRIDPDKLNVHLVAHTHDDVGWLKTIDQYYVGSNNSIHAACVQNVLDSVVEALRRDKNRRFIYVEQAFFQRWWRQQSERVREDVRELVRSGQLEFINGGMCMHDEAATHYIDMIDQTTLGHRFIKEEFGQVPRIAWQIDPFGHSAVQAYLLGAQAGFDAVYFFRIDYQDKEKRKDTKSLEIIWRGSRTLGSSTDIFAGIFPKNYEPPPRFYFEVNNVKAIPIQDDFDLFDYNVEGRVNDFVDAALAQANITRTNHIMWTMGTDFMYQYAESWFSQMDKLIHYVNLDGRVNALYSTPTIYTDAKFSTDESWPLKEDDFFPYADQPNAYWTGYFTSRPALKGYVRALSAYYLAARQLEFLWERKSPGLTINRLGDALAIAQHHDAVSGTEKGHVASDYAKRLAIGYDEAERLVGSSLACLAASKFMTECESPKIQFEQCPLLNITYCPPSEAGLSYEKHLVVLAYNPLGWNREDIIRIPVSSENIVVQDGQGQQVESQLLPIANITLGLRTTYTKAYTGKNPGSRPKFWLAFPVTVPPLGFNSYFIFSANPSGLKSTISSVHTYSSKDEFEVGPGLLRLVHNDFGKPSRYVNSKTLVNESIHHSYVYYSGQDSFATDPQASGAYIFRPNGTFILKNPSQMPTTVIRGPIIDEVHQSIAPWIFQITRIYRSKEHVETEFIVGPIPIDDGIGKEVAVQIITNLVSNKTFYTDSNGRDFIKRVRDSRLDWNLEVHQPVAGNYYPINLGIYIQDESRELSVLVDRSVGGSSIVDGQIELMIHRRLLFDDGRGVEEPLNEMTCLDDDCSGLTVQGKFYHRLDPLGEGAKWRRSFGQEVYSPLLLAFAEQDGAHPSESYVPSFKAMDPFYSLPENVALITLQVLEDKGILLRLAHLYEAGEDKDLSKMAMVHLKKIFPNKEILNVTEMSLTANQKRSEMEKKRLVWKVEGSMTEGNVLRGSPVDPTQLVVELAPMEIRTFILNFDSFNDSYFL